MQTTVSVQGADSRAQAAGKHQPVTLYLPHHQHSPGSVHHPCLWPRSGLPAEVREAGFTPQYATQPSRVGSVSICLFVFPGIRSCWTRTRRRTTSSVVPCAGWLFVWISSASLWSLLWLFSLSSCTIRFPLRTQAWPSHTPCRFVNGLNVKRVHFFLGIEPLRTVMPFFFTVPIVFSCFLCTEQHLVLVSICN